MSPSLRAVVFDFNGVVLDDEHIHYRAFAEHLRTLGVDLTQAAYFQTYLGLDDKTCMTRVLRDLGGPVLAERTQDSGWVWDEVEAKGEVYMRLIQGQMRLFPGVPELIAHLADHVPLAIASGARRREIEAVLAHADLARHFQFVITADEVTHGKPHPEGYRRAWEGLVAAGHADLVPAECLVFEDSPKGVTAAHDAGMRCIGVTTGTTAEVLGAAEGVVHSLQGLTVDRVAGLAGFGGVGGPRSGE